MGEPATSRRRLPGPAILGSRPAYDRVTLPPNEGALTALPSSQTRYLQQLIASALTGGNQASDAVRRAVEALDQSRLEAVSANLDSGDQELLRMFVTAGMRAGGLSSGGHVAMQAATTLRLYKEARVAMRKREKAKMAKGEVQ